jgi:hypothetical protein
MLEFHEWAKLGIILYGVVLMARHPLVGGEFLLTFALVEFVIVRGA